MLRIVLATAALAPSGAAYAHAGHVVEVAGHAHWLALGATLAAAAIAAVLGAKKGDDERDGEAEPEPEPAGDAA